MESQIRRYHDRGRIWYDAPTRVARAIVLVFGKSRTKTLVEVGSRRLVVEREWYNIRPSEDSELEGCSGAKGTTGSEDSAREKYR